MKIYVAGASGMVGSALTRALQKNPDNKVIRPNRHELDLRKRDDVLRFFTETSPDAVIVSAAKVGGIMANKNFPVDFLSENLQIQTNLLDGAHLASVSKLVFLGSSCIYPKHATVPIREESLLSGALEETNEPYALAKIAGVKLVQAYREQYGRNWISVMPTNLYGPGDSYDDMNSHVIPSLLMKMHRSKDQDLEEVELWGSGSPLREFLFVDDLAEAILIAMKDYDDASPLNIGSGEELSIKTLAEHVSVTVGFEGTIKWNRSMPDGTPRKLLDSTKIRSLGWVPKHSLMEGLQLSYEDFRQRYA